MRVWKAAPFSVTAAKGKQMNLVGGEFLIKFEVKQPQHSNVLLCMMYISQKVEIAPSAVRMLMLISGSHQLQVSLGSCLCILNCIKEYLL